MATQLSIDKDHTAVLIMDYQSAIVTAVVSEPEGLLDRAAAVLRAARQAGVPVVHVVVAFREGHPEISPRNKAFSGMNQAGMFPEGAPGTEVHPRVAPQPGEVIVTKRRVGAFATSDMETVLKAQDIASLILMGLATKGVVLSTVREAADADYEIVVVADCCADPDDEVHRVLIEKVFPSQAEVVSSQEIIQALSAP